MRIAPTILSALALAACHGDIGLNPLDATPPTVTYSTPPAGSIDEPVDVRIIVVFDRELDATSLDPATFRLALGGTNAVPAQLLYDRANRLVEVRHDGALAANAGYVLTVPSGVRNRSGVAAASNTVITFTTGVRVLAGAPDIRFSGIVPGSLVRATRQLEGSLIGSGVTNAFIMTPGVPGWTALGSDHVWHHAWNTTGLPPGTNTVIIRAHDSSGRASTNRIDLVVDNGAPAVTITFPVAAQAVSNTLTVTGTAADSYGLDRVEVKTGANTWTAAAGTTAWTYQWFTGASLDGTVTLLVRAFDKAGNAVTNQLATPVRVTNWRPLASHTAYSVGSGIPPSYDLAHWNNAWLAIAAYQDNLRNATARPVVGGAEFTETETVDGDRCEVEIDPWGNRHYAYWGVYPGSFARNVAYRSNNAAKAYVVTNFAGEGALDLSLRLAPADGKPHMLYAWGNYPTFGYYLYYLAPAAAGFKRFAMETTEDGFYSVDLALDANGYRHFVYRHKLGVDYAFVYSKKHVGTGLTNVYRHVLETSPDPASAPRRARIRVSGSDVHVAWCRAGGVYYRLSTDGGNTFAPAEAVSTADAEGVSLSLIGADPVLCWRESTNVYAAKRSAGWQRRWWLATDAVNSAGITTAMDQGLDAGRTPQLTIGYIAIGKFKLLRKANF